MSKLRVLAQKCAALLTLLHFSVHLSVQHLREKCSSSAALSFFMVRRILAEKSAIYRSSKCSSVSSFPNFVLEKELLRERIVISPVDDEIYDFDDGASIYLTEEFDHEDYNEWWDWMDSGSTIRWHKRAVDEAIADENNDPLGDIPF